MRHWRIVTQFSAKPFLMDNEGREIAVEAERVVIENGVAIFFKEGSDTAFMFINMYGIATINCEAELGLNRMIVLPPQALRSIVDGTLQGASEAGCAGEGGEGVNHVDHRTGAWFWTKLLYFAATSMVFVVVLLRFEHLDVLFSLGVAGLALASARDAWRVWSGP